ncbi:MAG: hypothetical protein LH632_13860 [Rhodoferax sp.]|nr:hypothetical protein [Rhodoferax sp.]
MSEQSGWGELLWRVPQRVDNFAFWLRAALITALAWWSVLLVRMDYRSGEIGQSFLHRPLLVFHEAGHVVFMPFGEWITMLGGTLGQLLVPMIIVVAFLVKNRDPFGASVGAWLLGVSVLDIAPYMYDALEPQLMLLSGRTGEDGGHDWIYLFDSLGWLPRAQFVGAITHKLGALLLMLSMAWAILLLRLQYRQRAGDVLHED